MEQPEWEKSKENVAPLREGRPVETLNAALRSSRAELETAKAAHEAAIVEAKEGRGPHADDPLAPCVLYAKWAVDNYPAGSSIICAAVEKPCRRFGKTKRYRDDIRLARLWVRYAEMRRDKLEAFDYMYRNRIGETAAIVYEIWAAALERARDFDKAEWVFNLGREKRAQPADRLAQRQNEYLKRMAARAKRNEKKEREKQIKNMVDTQRSEARQSRPQGRERSTVADALLATSAGMICRDAEAENEDPSTSAKNGPVRPALGAITDDEARTGHRPIVHPRGPSTGTRPQLSKPGNKKSAETFTVFSDKDGDAKPDVLSEQDDDANFKPMIAPHADLSKEDDGQPTKWAGETLPQNPALKRRRAEVIPASSSFNVYEGNDEGSGSSQDAENGEVSHHEALSKVDPLSAKTKGLGVKRAMPLPDTAPEGCATSDKDEQPVPVPISNGTPLAAVAHPPTSIGQDAGHQDPKKPASPTINTRMAIDGFDLTVDKARSLEDIVNDNGRPASPTINTRMAFEAVDGTFNDTRTMNHPFQRRPKLLHKGRQVPTQTVNSVKGSPFTIFSDSNNNVSNGNPPPAAGASKLEIFVDNTADKENAGGPRAPPSLVPGPTSIPDLESRVLQPLPELEFKETSEEEERDGCEHPVKKNVKLEMVVVKSESRDSGGRDPGTHEAQTCEKKALVNFLCQWFKSHNCCQILKEEPTDFDGMFDLEPERGDLLSLDPQCIYRGAEQKSIVILADDMNNVYGLKPALDESDDELDDIDVDAKPCIAVKVSTPENLWEFYIYRTLEERLGEHVESGLPRAMAFFEGRSSSFMVLNRIGLTSWADASSLFGDNGMSEIVCAFLLSDLLKVLESVHSAGVIHNDVTLDNVLVRNSEADSNDSNGDSASSLSKEGVVLVDFNNAVDSRHPLVEGKDSQMLAKHVASRGSAVSRSEYRASGCTEWAFNGDCYAAAVCAAKLLNVQVNDVPSKFLKHESLWTDVFKRLCSLDSLANAETTIACMRKCRELLGHAIAKDKWLKRHYHDFIAMTDCKRSAES